MSTMTTISRSAAALCAAGLLSLGFAATASADHVEPPTGTEANQAKNWVAYVEEHDYLDVKCFDVSEGWEQEKATFTAPDDYALVVLKNATHNDEFWEVEAGETIETDVHGDEPQHAISHVIACTAAMEDEPTTPPTTSTPKPTTPGTPIGPIVETDIVESGVSTTSVALGGAALLAGAGASVLVMRRKGQH